MHRCRKKSLISALHTTHVFLPVWRLGLDNVVNRIPAREGDAVWTHQYAIPLSENMMAGIAIKFWIELLVWLLGGPARIKHLLIFIILGLPFRMPLFEDLAVFGFVVIWCVGVAVDPVCVIPLLLMKGATPSEATCQPI